MGGALIKAAAKSIDKNDIYVYDRAIEKADAFKASLGVVSCDEEKVIKEVVVFFEDGTYQKFSSNLKN